MADEHEYQTEIAVLAKEVRLGNENLVKSFDSLDRRVEAFGQRQNTCPGRTKIGGAITQLRIQWFLLGGLILGLFTLAFGYLRS